MRRKDKNVLRCVGYVRVSTEEQAKEGYSIGSQKEAIENYARAQGWKISKWYVDKGKSAFQLTKSRPDYKRMMEDIDNWDIVIAKWLNRFWRRTLEALLWARDLENAGKSFVCVREKMDTTSAMGRAQMRMMMNFAELESDQTSERVIDAFDKKFKDDSNTWFTRPPLGYDMDKKNHRLVVNEHEAKAVQLAFQLALTRPQRDVALDVSVAGYRGKSGKPFTQPSIAHILHNPVYCGYVYRDGVLRKNGHKAIIPIELFNAVQKAMWQRGTKARKYPPLELGAKEIRCKRVCTSGRGIAVYVVENDDAESG